MIKRVLASLANYILPYRCSSCSQLIDKEQGMCAPCFSKLNFITSPYCSCCGFPFEFFIEGQNLCGRCVAKQPNYDLARSLFKFDLESKKLIHAFKYNDRTAHSKMFAKLIIARYKQEIEEVDKNLDNLHNLKVKACSLDDEVEKTRMANLIDAATNKIDEDLGIVRLKQSSETAFRARAYWYVAWQKSN